MTKVNIPISCFLTGDDAINELCLSYWSLNSQGNWTSSLKNLASDAGINHRSFYLLIKATSCTYILNIRCDSCLRPKRVTSRTNFETAIKKQKINQTYRCHDCKAAATAASYQEAAHKEAVQKTSAQIDIKNGQLNYTDAVLLYSLLLAAGEQWTDRKIAPISAQIGKLAPTIDLTIAIYLRLHQENLISPVLEASHRTLPTIGEDSYFNFRPHDVTWVLSDPISRNHSLLLVALESIITKFDSKSATDLWYSVAEAECERYFGELCERYRFKKEILYTEKVGVSIRYCLDRLSLPQVWNILWCTMRTIAALIQEGTYSHPHVYNMIPTTIIRDIDRRLANNQQIRPWGRLQPHKESVITSILFDKVFQKGTTAFEQVTGKNSSVYRSL